MQRPENSASSPRMFIDWGCSPTETSYQNYLTPLVLCLIYMLMLQAAMVVSKFKALTDSSLIAVLLCIYHFLIPLLPLARVQGFSHEGCDNRMASREDHEQMKHLGQNQVPVSSLTVFFYPEHVISSALDMVIVTSQSVAHPIHKRHCKYTWKNMHPHIKNNVSNLAWTKNQIHRWYY